MLSWIAFMFVGSVALVLLGCAVLAGFLWGVREAERVHEQHIELCTQHGASTGSISDTGVSVLQLPLRTGCTPRSAKRRRTKTPPVLV